MTRVLIIGLFLIEKARGATADAYNILDWNPWVIHWAWPQTLDQVQGTAVARMAGWTQDVMIAALLLALIATGASFSGDAHFRKLQDQKSVRKGKQTDSGMKR